MSAKVPVLGTILAACRLVARLRGELMRVGLVMLFGSFVLNVLALNYVWPMITATTIDAEGNPVIDPRLPGSMLLMALIEFLIMTVFSVGWHRVILLGSQQAGGGLGVQLGGRELRSLLKLGVCLLASFVLAGFLSTIETAIAVRLGVSAFGALLLSYLIVIPVIAFVAGRLGPSFAALAIDEPAAFSRALQLTAGNGARLLVIYLLAGFGWIAASLLLDVLAEVLGLGQIAPYALMFLSAVLSTALLAVLVTINALVYRQIAPGAPA
jgi:hypothetical protein